MYTQAHLCARGGATHVEDVVAGLRSERSIAADEIKLSHHGIHTHLRNHNGHTRGEHTQTRKSYTHVLTMNTPEYTTLRHCYVFAVKHPGGAPYICTHHEHTT